MLKNFKKALSLVLAVAMVCGLLNVSAFAATTDSVFTVAASSESVTKGDVFTITVSMSAVANKNVGGVALNLNYDATKLSYVDGSLEKGTVFSADNTDASHQVATAGNYIYYAFTTDDEGEPVSTDSELFKVKFKVLTESAGSVAPALTVKSFYDGTNNLNDLAYSVKQATVNIPKPAITAVSGVSVAAPEKGTALATSVTVGESAGYTGSVAWYEGTSATGTPVTGNAKANTQYTAKITLTANSGETFADSLNDATTDEGYQITKVSATKLTLTKTFEKTTDKALSSIAVATGLTVAVPAARPNQTGEAYVVLTATGTYDDGTSDAVNAAWEIVGDAPAGVSIVEGNKLKVTNDVTAATTVTVKATVGDKSNTGTVSITRSEAAVTNIVATALAADKTVNVAAAPQTTNAPTAKVYDQYGKEMTDKTVEWAISGTTPTGVSIDPATGKLTVDKTAQESTVDIYAKIGTVESDKLTYFIKRAASVATTVTISGGVTELTVPTVDAIGGTSSTTAETAFTAEVKDQFGEVMNGASVTWSVSGNDGVNLNSDNKLVITNVATDANVTVKAACGEKYDEKSVTVNKGTSTATFVQILKSGTPVTTDTVTIPASDSWQVQYNAKVYDQYGKEITTGAPTVVWSVTGSEKATIDSSTGKLTVSHEASAGNVTVTAKVNDTAKADLTVTLSQKPAHNIGTFTKPSLEVTYCRSVAGQTVTSSTAGTVKYSSSDPSTVEVNETTGTLTIYKVTSGTPVTITAKVAETGTYAEATATYTVTVNQKELTITGLTAVNRDYVKDNTTVALTGGAMPGVVSGDEVSVTIPTTGTIENANAGSGKAVTVTTPALTGADEGNYTLKPITGITVTISKVKSTGKPDYTAITTSGKTLADANLTIGTIAPADGTIKWVDADNIELDPATEVKANTSYKWLFTPNDPNYETLTGSIKLWNKSSSSGGGGGGGAASYAITVESGKHGTVSVSPKSAFKGDTVAITVTPDAGYTLETLTVLDKNGKEITVTAKNGKYTFKMPASKVTVKATFMEDNTMLNFFVDVPADAYYYDAVLWAVKNGVTNGLDETHFAPDLGCTRAQIVTFLWRAAGSPEPKTLSTFSDVPADAYYAKAVAWAVEKGITKGVTETEFMPNATCTRAHAVTFLCRSEGSPVVNGSTVFVDVATGRYYADAVAWAVEHGVTNGVDATHFCPDLTCTRAQIVTFLYRCVNAQ